MGVITAGVLDGSHGAVPVHLLPLRQKDTKQEQICQVVTYSLSLIVISARGISSGCES